MEKWVNRPHISIDQKSLQNLGLKGNSNSKSVFIVTIAQLVANYGKVCLNCSH